MFEVGKSYLVCLSFGWVFCGRYEGAAGLGHRWSQASYVVNTGGKPWPEFAVNGNRKEAVTKRFHGAFMSGLQILWSCEWMGDLP